MKKLFLMGMGFVLAIAVFGIVGLAYAHLQEPPEPPTTIGPEFPYGRAGWSQGTNGGMMDLNFDHDELGSLHDYLFPAIAEAFGMTDEQIEAFEIARQTVWDIRSDLTIEDAQATMQQAFNVAIDNALADGAISEDQAERWLERLEWMGDRAPGVFIPGRSVRGRMQSYQQGFTTGFRFSRQIMLNHEYMDAALADSLDISVEALREMRAEEGFTWQGYAEEQGIKVEELSAWRIDVITNAVEAALADGAITQEQANWILGRLDAFEANNGWFEQP